MGFSFTKIAKINCHFPGRRLPARYYLLILVLFFCLHLILYNIHESYRATFLSKIAPAWLLDDKSNSGSACFNTSATMIDQWPHPGHLPQLGKFNHPLALITNDYVNYTGCANATFVILARNDELTQLVKSLSDIEARFNHRHHYPYVFLNDEPFTDHFKK
jgi:alpha 1,2-mannosyltransferase